MKGPKLTPKQREIFEILKRTEGGVLRQHVNPSNIVCFRLLDAAKNPVCNYQYRVIRQLIDKDVLQISGIDYILKATSFHG